MVRLKALSVWCKAIGIRRVHTAGQREGATHSAMYEEMQTRIAGRRPDICLALTQQGKASLMCNPLLPWQGLHLCTALHKGKWQPASTAMSSGSRRSPGRCR